MNANPVHSLRCPTEVWEAARGRAEADHMTMSHVAFVLLEGYGRGIVNLPETPPALMAEFADVDELNNI